jgi:hypothetical protein
MMDHNMHCLSNVFFGVLECAQIWQFHVLFSPFLPLGIFCHCAVSLCLFPSMMSLSLLYTALGAVKFVHSLVVFLCSMLGLQKQI